ncbi:MAG: glutamate--cysteine ligase [Gammaproteobacteria bacterium]|nr:glutamate--cysteine ligase [Gammaproteobacteria bacterium]
MNNIFKNRIDACIQANTFRYFEENLIGVEKESLRVNPEGVLAQTLHPTSLGSTFTHPYITTDYSEALLELITPPLSQANQIIDFLHQYHLFVYQNLDNEFLWATSMPCILHGSTSIPIAKYGTSNLGKMKMVYREGLGLRYGREMQVIAGVHFNFSLSENFWSAYQGLNIHNNSSLSLTDFSSEHYFNLIRNLQRYGWLIPYLFGASPAVCKSFIAYEHDSLDSFDESTYYEPYATSLRMGDIGYQNNKENETGIKACYNNIDTYINSLKHAITTPYSGYLKLGVKNSQNEYQQLNGNILQIENEYYSTVRPKQILSKNEQPSMALKKRGVNYVELRSLDVNAFDPVGINEVQLNFLESFVIYCLLEDSPNIDNLQRKEIDENEMITAHRGREKGLLLSRNGQKILLTDWASEICTNTMKVAELLDRNENTKNVYQNSVEEQFTKIKNPDKTPSAIMLNEMRENKESFHQFAYRRSKLNQHYFLQQTLSDNVKKELQTLAKESIIKQKEIEAEPQQDFDEFLESYFNVYKSL